MARIESAQISPDHGTGAFLPTLYGTFRALAYSAASGGDAHLALIHGRLDPSRPVLLRLHSECLTGDSLGSLRCDCGPQLQEALRQIGRADSGVLLYLRQEGRGIGLAAKMQAYVLQDRGADTYDANVQLGFAPDARDYAEAADILRDLGIARVVLLSNNPAKAEALRRHGIEVVEERPLEIPPGKYNWRYLTVKRQRFGHRLQLRPQALAAGAQ